MFKFEMVSGYLDILSEVGAWKVVPVKSLYEANSFNLSNRSIRRKVNELERQGFLKTLDSYNRSKVVTLTGKGKEVVNHGVVFDKDSDSLYHDITVTQVLTRLIKDKVFLNGYACACVSDHDLEPDGVLFGVKNQKEYTLALEVELTQKSRPRVIDKFSKYSESKEYNYVLYVTQKESIFRGYKKICGELKSEIQKRIIILYDPSLKSNTFNYLESSCYFKNKNVSFTDIFPVHQLTKGCPVVSDPASPRTKKSNRINKLPDAKIDHPLSTSFDEVVNLR